jgi:hypothetical protein
MTELNSFNFLMCLGYCLCLAMEHSTGSNACEGGLAEQSQGTPLVNCFWPFPSEDPPVALTWWSQVVRHFTSSCTRQFGQTGDVLPEAWKGWNIFGNIALSHPSPSFLHFSPFCSDNIPATTKRAAGILPPLVFWLPELRVSGVRGGVGVLSLSDRSPTKPCCLCLAILTWTNPLLAHSSPPTPRSMRPQDASLATASDTLSSCGIRP